MTIINKLLWALLAGIIILWLGGGTPAEADEVPPETFVVCIDTFEDDDISGCFLNGVRIDPGVQTIDGPATVLTTDAPGVDWCNLNDGGILQPGEFVPETQPPFSGSTRFHVTPCGPPIVATAPPPTPPVAQQTLPATGHAIWLTALVAAALVCFGGLISTLARR